MAYPGNGSGRGTFSLPGNTQRTPGTTNPSYINYMDFIPSFSGEEGRGSSAGDFFETLYEIAREAGWSTTITKHVLKTKLTGPALKFFCSNPRIKVMNDLTSIRRLIVKHFSIEKTSTAELRQFLDCHQMRGEAVRDFAMRLELSRESLNNKGATSREVQIGDEMLYNVFLEGLDQNISDKLMMFDIGDYESCLDAAEKIEIRLEKQNSRNKKILVVDKVKPEPSLKSDTIHGQKEEASLQIEDNSARMDFTREKFRDLDLSTNHKREEENLAAKSLPNWTEGRDGNKAENNRVSSLAPNKKGGNSLGYNNAVDKPKFFDSSAKTTLFHRVTQKGTKVIVKIFLGRNVMEALLDSASDITLMSIEALKDVNLSKHVYIGEPARVVGTNHSIIESRRYIDLKFRFEGCSHNFCHTFYVVPQDQILGYGLIFGSDFIIAHGGVMDNNRGTFTVQGDIVVPMHRVVSSEVSSQILSITRKLASGVQTDKENKEWIESNAGGRPERENGIFLAKKVNLKMMLHK